MASEGHDELPSNVIRFPGRVDASAGRRSGSPFDTTLLATQIRGWSDVVDALGERAASAALGRAVDATIETIGEHGGSDVVVEGAAGQPDVTATFSGPHGPQRAIAAAASLRVDVARVQSPAEPDHQFRVGSGIDTARTGVRSTSDGVAYVETGTLRAAATRLRDFAGPGQIFLTDTTLASLGDSVTVQPLGPIRVDPDGQSRDTFSLTQLN